MATAAMTGVIGIAKALARRAGPDIPAAPILWVGP